MKTHELKMGAGNFVPAVLDEHVAPGISSFVEAQILDLEKEFPESEHWVANHFLNTVLRGRFKEPLRQFAFNYLSRTWLAFKAYHDARRLTLEYLDEKAGGNTPVSTYTAAIAAWEIFLLNWWIGFQFLRRMNDGEGFFKKGDGSSQQRMHDMANEVKHWPAQNQIGPGDLVPVRLANGGLSSSKNFVSFEELGELLRDTARLAEQFVDSKRLAEVAAKHYQNESDGGNPQDEGDASLFRPDGPLR